jgi:Beta-lactamase
MAWNLAPPNVLAAHSVGPSPLVAPVAPVSVPASVLTPVMPKRAANLQQLTAGLRAMAAEVAGLSFEIRSYGATAVKYATGWARRPIDGAQSYTPSTPQNVGSVSKLFTASAMYRLLADRHVSQQDPIAKYLPTYWNLGPNMGAVTIYNLLTHTSGFIDVSSRTDYPYMRGLCEAGVVASNVGQYAYRNVNFSLCRIIASVILGAIATSYFEAGSDNDVAWDLITTTRFIDYLQTTIFSPSGVSGATLTRRPGSALAYGQPLGAGWDSGDLTSVCGAGGWHLTAGEALDVVGTLRRTGRILPVDTFQAQLGHLEGLDNAYSSPLGVFFEKGGNWVDGQQHTEQAAIFILPAQVEVMVLVNSPLGPGSTSLPDFVKMAYLSALS